ncbi:hypothetical protein OSTOST_00339 [Ostertagia ostertagi]
MSGTPPLSHQLPRINKFVGEAFEEQAISRTIFVSSEEDTTERESRVILLVGPQSARKTSLIDFFCNYFYGAQLDEPTRYHIANEKFDSTTPEKQIITYVFNDTKMDFRPIVIDTPSTSGPHGEENRRILAEWLKENDKLKLDTIGVVFSAYSRLTSEEEEGLQKAIITTCTNFSSLFCITFYSLHKIITFSVESGFFKALQLFPSHMRVKQVVFMTGSDGSSLPVGLLRRFNLDRANVYKVNTSCIFQRPEDDPLQEHLRGNYWRMSVANFEALFSRLKYEQPPSHLHRTFEIPQAATVSLGESSRSSQAATVSLGESSRSSQTATVSQGGSSKSSQSSRDTVIRNMSGISEDSVMKGPYLLQGKTSDNNNVAQVQSSSQKPSELLDYRMNKTSREETITTHSDHITESVHRLETRPVEHKATPEFVTQSVESLLRKPITVNEHSSRNVSETTSRFSNGTIPAADGISTSGLGTATEDRLHELQPQVENATVTRYVYEVATRSHKKHYVGAGAGDPAPTERKAGSSSRVSRETTIDDPYYPVVVRPSGASSTGRHSSYEIRPETTMTSGTSNNGSRKTPVETLIDFRSENGPPGTLLNREPIPYFSLRKSRSAGRIDTNTTPGGREFVVDVRRNPEYTLKDARYRQVPPSHTGSEMNAGDNVSNHTTMSTGVVPLSKIVARGPSERSQGFGMENVRMRNSDELLLRERDGERRGSTPSYTQRYVQAIGTVPLYDQPPGEDMDRSEFVTAEAMRNQNQRPITHIEVNRKPNAQGSVRSYQHNDSDYGDDWGEETRIVHKVHNQTHPLPQLVEEVYRNRHYPGTAEKHVSGTPTSITRPSYIPLPYPSQSSDFNNPQGGRTEMQFGGAGTGPQVSGRNGMITRENTGMEYGGGEIRSLNVGQNGIMTMERTGMDYGGAETRQLDMGRNGVVTVDRTGMEYGGADARLLNDGRGGMLTTKKVTTTVTNTKRQPFQIRILRWTPSNFSNSRDCCLNCLFFVVVPLVVIVIVVVIVLVVVFS